LSSDRPCPTRTRNAEGMEVEHISRARLSPPRAKKSAMWAPGCKRAKLDLYALPGLSASLSLVKDGPVGQQARISSSPRAHLALVRPSDLGQRALDRLAKRRELPRGADDDTMSGSVRHNIRTLGNCPPPPSGGPGGATECRDDRTRGFLNGIKMSRGLQGNRRPTKTRALLHCTRFGG
jgi:hypothetical protein